MRSLQTNSPLIPLPDSSIAIRIYIRTLITYYLLLITYYLLLITYYLLLITYYLLLITYYFGIYSDKPIGLTSLRDTYRKAW